MLVLSRHKNETIVVGDDVRIVVADIRGDKVRIAIEAPLGVPVHREEVYERIEHRTKTTLVPLPVDVMAQAEKQASLAGIPVEKFLSLVVGLGLARIEV